VVLLLTSSIQLELQLESKTNNYIVNAREISGESIAMLDKQLKADPEGGYTLLISGKSYSVTDVHLDLDRRFLTCRIDNKLYSIDIETPFDQLIDGMGFTDMSTAEVNEVKAPMPGLVFDIMVNEGDEVALDDPLMILEAMKMENIIKSPKDGKIKSILVNKTASVEKNAILIEFE